MKSWGLTSTLASLASILTLAAGDLGTLGISNHWWQAGNPISTYNCAGKEDGNYPNPESCSSYIACSNWNAYLIPCPIDPITGAPLHYLASSGPNPLFSRCVSIADANCQLSTVPDPLVCQHDECRQVGNCYNYQICTNGTWVNKKCSSGLFWNSEVDNGFGGSCDFYTSLPDKLKELYTNNPNCIAPCEWWQEKDEICTRNYHFRKPLSSTMGDPTAVRELALACPSAPLNSGLPDLIWDQEARTCAMRKDVAGC